MANLRRLVVALCVPLAFAMQSGADAQNPTQNNQPVRGELHERETKLKDRLQVEYKAGRIDSNILAKMQRDLDGICVKEDELRMQKDGFTDKDREDIHKKLDTFEEELGRMVTRS